ncbi:MAG: MBL fold metallo-hydrolase, partial [Arthrobacter sp.]|nr:MBL fold metallo-hydrolase [Arthrobacter sp.]
MDSLIHSLRDITIRRISVSEMDNNVYLLTSKASGAQLLIDAADDLAAIQGLLASAVLEAVWATALGMSDGFTRP